MNDGATVSTTVEESGDQGVLIPLARFDVLLRSAKFAAAMIRAMDANDTLSSVEGRAIARAYGLIPANLYEQDFEDLVRDMTPPADDDEAQHAE